MLLYPIWLVFAALFLSLAFQEWRLSKQEIRKFRVREGEWKGEAGEVLQDFAQDYNRYVDAVNENYRDKHRSAMIGYVIAGLLSIFSLFATLPGVAG